MGQLHITNGDSTVALMRAAGIPGLHLPWRDVLHAGPVPGGLSLAALSRLRARFIVEQGWGTREAVETSFRERDAWLERCAEFDRILLWFEHDLYDQLQLLQILSELSERPACCAKLGLILSDRYLSEQSASQLDELQHSAASVTEAQLGLARRAWAAFRAATPLDWQGLLAEDTHALPYLHDAVLRLLEEYPSVHNGLSRTEQAALEIIAAGEGRPAQLFARYQAGESRRFLGDTSFWMILQRFLDAEPALATLDAGRVLQRPPAPTQSLALTDIGQAVLHGERDGFQASAPARWIGGVRLVPPLWRWDAAAGRLQHS